MRVKRSADFQMAPKKATKGKGVAAELTRDESSRFVEIEYFTIV